MRHNYYKIQGVTLLEILLVLAISSAIILFGIQQYTSYQSNIYQDQLRHNVDSLFQGLANYYRANCIEYLSSSGRIKQGSLDPVSEKPPTPPWTPPPWTYPIDIHDDLYEVWTSGPTTPGFLSRWPFLPNPLLKLNHYVVQFNLTEPSRSQGMSATSSPPLKLPIYLLKAQVAVELSDKASQNANAYQQLLGADCLSDASTVTFFGISRTIVTPCSESSGGNYLVWERLPSFASPNTTTDLWPAMPLVNQFLQMYNTYPINALTNGTITNQGFWCNG